MIFTWPSQFKPPQPQRPKQYLKRYLFLTVERFFGVKNIFLFLHFSHRRPDFGSKLYDLRVIQLIIEFNFSSSRGIRGLWPLQTPAFRSTSPYAPHRQCTNTMKIKALKCICFLKSKYLEVFSVEFTAIHKPRPLIA